MICTIVSDGSELLPGKNNEKERPYPQMKEKLREIIWQLFIGGYNEFNLNCEYGIPLWAAEIICGLKMYNEITLHVFMPYEEQAADWTEEQRDRYFTIHEKSDDVRMIHTRFRSDSYNLTDYEMVCKSDLLCIFKKDIENTYAQLIAPKKGIEIKQYRLI